MLGKPWQIREPSTDWLLGCMACDEKGFIRTSVDLTQDELDAADWPLTRAPHTLETSLAGIFAVGDVRAGSMKRVASAVGEGAAAVALCTAPSASKTSNGGMVRFPDGGKHHAASDQ